MSIRSCTCSSCLTHFLPIRQEFDFFTRDRRKCLRSPCYDIIHVRWSSNFEKCDGSILNYPFGGCFTKPPVFCTRKIENGLVQREGKLTPTILLAIPWCTCIHNMGILSQTMLDSSHNIGHLTWSQETSNEIGHFMKVF